MNHEAFSNLRRYYHMERKINYYISYEKSGCLGLLLFCPLLQIRPCPLDALRCPRKVHPDHIVPAHELRLENLETKTLKLEEKTLRCPPEVHLNHISKH
jgi:hypothetical protein